MIKRYSLARWILAAFLVVQHALPIPLRADSFEERDSFNHVVIIVDTTGSFEAHLEDSWEWILKLLGKFRKSRQDQITLIRLDGDPKVIFDLRAHQFGKAREKFLAIKTASQGCCTDVAGALNLAAFVLGQDRWAGRKVLLIFSDLVNEPQGRPVPPPKELAWQGLQGIELSAFFVAPEQILQWRQLLEAHGIKGDLLAPAPAEYALSRLEPYTPPESPEGDGGSFLLIGLKRIGVALGLLAGLALATSVFVPMVGRLRRRKILNKSPGSRVQKSCLATRD